MSNIKKILGWENHQTYAKVHVQMEDGTEGAVWIGGACEVFFDRGSIKVFVKKGKT